MNHNPVCAKCQVEMRPETNGIGVLDMADFGPYQLWQADLWKCPVCGNEIIVGFAKEATTEHYLDGFDHTVNLWRNAGKLRICWQNQKQKEATKWEHTQVSKVF